jgi:hypothetical protein
MTMFTKHKKPSSHNPNRKKQNMNRANYGKFSQAILASLKQYGGMSRAEIEVFVGIPKESISAIVSRLHKSTPRMGKQIYISHYIYDAEGQRRYPRAVYNLGALPDVPKPKSNPKETKRRYLQGVKAKYTMNSVFNLGMTRDQIRAQMKGTSL